MTDKDLLLLVQSRVVMGRDFGVEVVGSQATQSRIVLGSNLHVLDCLYAQFVVNITLESVGLKCVVVIVAASILMLDVGEMIRSLSVAILSLPRVRLLLTSKVSDSPLMQALLSYLRSIASIISNPLGLYPTLPLLRILLVVSISLLCYLLLLGQMTITWPQYSHLRIIGGILMSLVLLQTHHMGASR